MWIIENVDSFGEGMFICDAASKEEALRKHAEKNKDLEVTRCEQSEWVDLALITGRHGASSYFQTQFHDTRNIADRTEQELIQCILELYAKNECACLQISMHIAEKLTQRRKIIRERRRNGALARS